MSKVLSVAKNEMKQQFRRKAIWIGFILIAVVVAFFAIPPTPKNMSPWINNDIAVCCSISGYLSYVYLLITVLCAGRLCNKIDDYYDILASTPLTKHQFYAGKILGNTMLYSIFDFIMMLIFIPAYFINHHVAYNGFMIIPYFFIHYILECLLIALFCIAFIAMFDLIFKNAIVSSVAGLLYYLIFSNYKIMNAITFGKYLSILNSGSYYSLHSQTFFVPSQYQNYLKVRLFSNFYGYTTLNGFIALSVVIAFIILFYIIGLAIFKMAESSHLKLSMFNKNVDAYGHSN